MIELTKHKDRIYLFNRNNPKSVLSGAELHACKEVIGPFRFGYIKAKEKGTDGNVYITDQFGIEFTKDEDAVVFLMIMNGND